MLPDFNGNKEGVPCIVYGMVTFRIFFLFLLATGLTARASDPINAPSEGKSATVSQPHVTAELIPETTNVQPGQPFEVALHLHTDADWHTYWINPGDAGLATTIKWTLPPGFTAGPIQWPTPEIHTLGTEITYGYAGDVYLLTTITPPKGDLPKHFDIKAKAQWLVCKEECIPGSAELTLPLDSGLLNLRLPTENKELFAQARERLPLANTKWQVSANYTKDKTVDGREKDVFLLWFTGPDWNALTNAQFFPEQANVLSALPLDSDAPAKPAPQAPYVGGSILSAPGGGYGLSLLLQQNGDKPDRLSGVLVSDHPLIGNAKAVYIAEFPVSSKVAADVPIGGSASSSTTAPPMGTSAATSEPLSPATQPLLIAVLGAAFIGGLILNLMPCVLPVLSLKVFSLMKHAGENPKTAWIQGAAFTAGVVISFWILAGLLIALQTAGNHLGWGFQMQSPGFVLALIFVFFLLGLNLFGVFELGTSLVGLDAKANATGKFHGTTSSFLNGALATLAATPCTAPFMGSSLGFAAQQPAAISLLIFTFLALGMATPYLLLTIFPGALRFVPKPGAWMEAFKQFMGFLLMATVIFLLYVFGALVGDQAVYPLLFWLLIAALAAWRFGILQRSSSNRWTLLNYAFICLLAGALLIYACSTAARSDGTVARRSTATTEDGWQPWSTAAVDAALAQNRPVFVDFTAAWCLSCKVNEKVALDTDAVRKAFTDQNVVLLKADWTHSDPEISKALRQYNRDGVPLYLLYSPKNKDAPQVLPEVLTPGIVLDALKNL